MNPGATAVDGAMTAAAAIECALASTAEVTPTPRGSRRRADGVARPAAPASRRTPPVRGQSAARLRSYLEANPWWRCVTMAEATLYDRLGGVYAIAAVVN